MMASRNPKVKPAQKSVRNKQAGKKEQTKAWVDKKKEEMIEMQESDKEALLDSSVGGSTISVREADNPIDTTDDEWALNQGETSFSQNGTSDKDNKENEQGISNGVTTVESDSLTSINSELRRQNYKRNTVVPGEEPASGRDTPDSHVRKGAWDIAQDADNESESTSSRPSSAPAQKRPKEYNDERPATAKERITKMYRPITPKSKGESGGETFATGATSAESSQAIELSEMSSENTGEVYANPQATETAVVPYNKESSMVRSSEDSRSLVSTRSSNCMLAPPKLAGEQNAYIPFLYAKDSIQKVMEDMKKMKGNHFKIVEQIQDQYKLIEDDTQGQFNTFVLNLRSEYSGKVTTFRHVIEVHRTDLQHKESFYQNTIKSLQGKNKVLLQEKRDVMIKNREEILNLQNEKVTAVRELTRMLDEKHAKHTATLALLKQEKQTNHELEEKIKELEARLAALGQDKDSNIAFYEEEIKNLKSKNEEEVTELKQKLDLLEKEKTEEKSEADEMKKKLEIQIATLEMQVEAMKKQGAFVVPVPAPVIQTTVVTKAAKTREVISVIKTDEEGKEVVVEQKREIQAEIRPESQEVQVKVEGEQNVQQDVQLVAQEIAPEAQLVVATQGVPQQQVGITPVIQATPSVTKTVTVTQQVYMDAEEKSKLLAQIEKYKDELSQSKEELDKTQNEITKSNQEIDEKNEKILNIEEEVSLLSKEKSRFEKSATENKQELHTCRQQVESLRAQLQTLLATAVVTQKDDSESEEKLKAAEEEKAALLADQAKFKAEVERLQEEFKTANEGEGEETVVEDRSDEIQELMDKLKEEERKLQEKENTIAVMTMLKEGVVPETVTVVGGGGDDMEKLEKLEETNSKLEQTIEKLEVEIERLQKEKEAIEDKNVQMNENNSDLQEKVNDLQERISELKETIEDVTKDLEDAKNVMPMSVINTGSVETREEPGATAEEMEEINTKITELQEEIENAFKELQEERENHSVHLEELNNLKLELGSVKEGNEGEVDDIKAQLAATQGELQSELDAKQKALDEARARIDELEKQLHANVPVDTAKELKKYQNKIQKLEAEKESTVKSMATLQASVSSLTVKITNLNKKMETHKKNEKELVESHRVYKEEKEKEIAQFNRRLEMASKPKKEDAATKKKIETLQKRIKELEVQGVPKGASKIDTSPPKKDSKMEARLEEKYEREVEKLKAQVDTLKKASKEDSAKIRQLEKDLKEAKDKADKKPAVSAEDRQALKKLDKQLKDLQKKYDMDSKRLEKTKETLKTTEDELAALQKEYNALEAESKRDKLELSKLGVAAKEGIEAAMKNEELTKEVKKLNEENKVLTENFNSERILRKKYYNIVEDMKGKIRVYCRARPLSTSELDRGNHSVIKSPDEYSIIVDSQRGNKDFQYDQVFMPEATQERVFEDTNNLIQSSVDGYNVCIFAYGQTGSGKTMIGDRDGNLPGIAPRAMSRIFSVMDENKKKFSFKVSCYMLELYNDKLLDLLVGAHHKDEQKLDIKKDKKGLVFVQGAVVEHAKTRDELWTIFQRGSENRHVASTKMNAESSRSHLILSIIIESTNLTTGAIVKGKLSLVDLAGSERAAKTDASAEQLKEAQSINKSLSALGDVISALSSEQSFIPYRNNKLTMLMQDSLGGNAKTLMFVNISPADYNTDETITSLTYASRVKLITNDAQKNSDNKEIARLKGIITKLKKGEHVDEED